MKREYIYRGLKKDGTFAKGYLLSDSAIGKWGNAEHYTYATVDPKTVGQYTGLKDKKANRDVYEHDIYFEIDNYEDTPYQTVPKGTWIIFDGKKELLNQTRQALKPSPTKQQGEVSIEYDIDTFLKGIFGELTDPIEQLKKHAYKVATYQHQKDMAAVVGIVERYILELEISAFKFNNKQMLTRLLERIKNLPV